LGCEIAFLLAMNEVNIKSDFVISQKKFFIDFLDELGLFIEEKPICTTKKNPSLPSAAKRLAPPLLSFPFNLETSPFGSVNDSVPNRSY
jgi:hypothetical protein